jgi:prepilin-type N-terminal cleavage/methylation domain-containing protein/prepilin-type processing-associated H-X9-DG protein
MRIKRNAFTLIELLVVIAVIASLIAVLVPVLKSVRENSKAVVCGSNVRQLYFALAAYETQNRAFPYGNYVFMPPVKPPGGYVGSSVYDSLCWWWFDFASDFLGKSRDRKSLLWCPSRHIKETVSANILLGNYGVNEVICKIPTTGTRPETKGLPLRLGQIQHPSQTLLVMDSGYSVLTWFHAIDPDLLSFTLENDKKDSGYVPGLYTVNKKRLWKFRPVADFSVDALEGRHPNRTVNVGFVDGHLTRQNADNLQVQKAGSEYKNQAPLWLP